MTLPAMLLPAPRVGDTITLNLNELFSTSFQYPAEVLDVDPDTLDVDVHVNTVGVTVYRCPPYLGRAGAANHWLWPTTEGTSE